MKIIAYIFLISSGVLAYADNYTAVINSGQPVRCNGSAWTGQQNYKTVWKQACSPLELKDGAAVDSAISGCDDNETANYTISSDHRINFIGCTS